MDTGHWEFPHEFDPSEWFGFIYRITEKHTGRQYIGKKQFQSTRRVKLKSRKNRKVVRKESDWKTYTGSSTHLNAAIEQHGKENYEFHIESLHETKGSLYYAEVKIQVEENVLLEELENGERKYYNGNIAAVKFRPPKETLKETEFKRKNVAPL